MYSDNTDFCVLNLEGLNEVCELTVKTGLPYTVKLPERPHKTIYNHPIPFKVGYNDGVHKAIIDATWVNKNRVIKVYCSEC